jgi:DNA-binding FadR family transcriptional regulator
MSHDWARVRAALIADIAASRVRPGERLPSDAELGRRFGAAPEVVRAALRALEDHGMARLGPDGCATVSPEAQWDVLDPEILEILLASPHGSAILAEYLEYRRLVEIVAAELAAEYATSEDLAKLSDALAAMAAAAEQTGPEAEAGFHEADVAFHQALIAAGRNRPLELATGSLHDALCTARRPLARPELRQARCLPEHQRILMAVAQADPDAAREAMKAHLDSVETYLREYLNLSEASARPDER